MWDRIVNFVYGLIGDMSNKSFYIMMGVLITLGFYFLANFLKANKKEVSKVAKISQLLMSILLLTVFIVIANIRH
jgi:putative effector of murein hydrolase